MATNIWTFEVAPESAPDAAPKLATQPIPPRITRTPSADGSLRKSSKLSCAENGPRLLLESCHSRIRSFTLLATRLTLRHFGDATDEVTDAAVALQRYFGDALPRHIADEEDSLARRVHHWVPTTDLLEMASQHCVIDDVLGQLLPLWHQLAEAPADLPTLVLELAPPSSELAALWEPHLRREELQIFPLLDRLPPAEIAAIWREMRDRRLPGNGNRS